jgi:hypothetical protein
MNAIPTDTLIFAMAAVVHYRTLFDELLEVKPTSTAHTSAGPVPVHS